LTRSNERLSDKFSKVKQAENAIFSYFLADFAEIDLEIFFAKREFRRYVLWNNRRRAMLKTAFVSALSGAALALALVYSASGQPQLMPVRVGMTWHDDAGAKHVTRTTGFALQGQCGKKARMENGDDDERVESVVVCPSRFQSGE